MPAGFTPVEASQELVEINFEIGAALDVLHRPYRRMHHGYFGLRRALQFQQFIPTST